MRAVEPLFRDKEGYTEIVDRISLPNSPVGIDAQYTHAIIITYLREIMARVEKLESVLEAKKNSQASL